MSNAFITATEAADQLRSGTLTVEKWIHDCLARIDARDGAVRAWVRIDRQELMIQARACDRAGPGGALFGVPVGVKDVILTEQLPTGYNSPIYSDHFPAVDAGCVKILRAAGAIVLGKTDTVEFAAAKRLALTRNPHDLERTPGGSSSGSAAAVADFHVPIALGTQTGGSLIRPASFCGVFAMKPTWGLVTRDGVRLYAASLDTVGWYGRSVADLALVHGVFDPDGAADLQSSDLRGARIGVCRTPYWDRAEEPTLAAMKQAIELLRNAGARTAAFALPDDFATLDRDQWIIMRSEGRAAFLPEYRADHAHLNTAFRDMVENAEGISRRDLVKAYDRAAAARATFDEIASGYDAILAPSTVGTAPVGLASTGSADFNGIWTLLHVPCINIAGFKGHDGLPVGLTLTAARFEDRRLLEVAAAVEKVIAAA